MSQSLIMQAGLIIAVSIGGVYYLRNKGTPPVAAEAAQADASVEKQTGPQSQILRAHQPQQQAAILGSQSGSSASVVSIPKDRASGQFLTHARVDTGTIKFLVDTGASVIALTPEDAKKAGYDPSRMTYSVPINTANGKTYGAGLTLRSVSVGAITVRNVDAVVIPDGLHVSLLGMSFLGDLQKVEATPHALILRY